MLDKPATSERESNQLRPAAFGIPIWPIGLWGLGAPNEIGSNVKALEGLAMLGTEWVEFVNRRLKEDINLLPRLVACRCAEEISNVYAEFWRNLGQDYTSEFAALSKLAGDLATSAFTASGRKPQS
jgi:phasin protein